MKNDAPVLFQERVHITQHFWTWLLMCLFVWVWGGGQFTYSIEPLSNPQRAELWVKFSTLWTILWVMMIYGWRTHIQTEVHADGIHIHNGFRIFGRTKHYRRENIRDFEIQRWHIGARFLYVWPFRNRAHISYSRAQKFGVRLTLQSHGKVFIETHRPSEFMVAINQMIRQEFRPPSPHPFDRYPPE